MIANQTCMFCGSVFAAPQIRKYCGVCAPTPQAAEQRTLELRVLERKQQEAEPFLKLQEQIDELRARVEQLERGS